MTVPRPSAAAAEAGDRRVPPGAARAGGSAPPSRSDADGIEREPDGVSATTRTEPGSASSRYGRGTRHRASAREQPTVGAGAGLRERERGGSRRSGTRTAACRSTARRAAEGARPVDETRARDEVAAVREAAPRAGEVAAVAAPEAVAATRFVAPPARPTRRADGFRPARETMLLTIRFDDAPVAAGTIPETLPSTRLWCTTSPRAPARATASPMTSYTKLFAIRPPRVRRARARRSR